MTPAQLEAAADVFRMGAKAAGYVDDRWTTARFAEVIHARFGVKYDSDHMGRIIHKLGLRAKPEVPVAPAAPMTPALTMPSPASAPEFVAQDESTAASSAA